MEKFFLRLTLLISLVTINACSGGGETTEPQPIDSNILVSGTFNQYDSTKIVGTGTIRLLASVPVLTSRSFYLKGTLDDIVSSSISTIFYSPNSSVPNSEGIAIKFRRSGINVAIDILVNNNSVSVTSSKLSFYLPTALDVVIDIHNVNNKTRILIWRRDTLDYTVASADVDSDKIGDLSGSLPIQAGGGGFFGLTLENASVSSARVDLPKVLD